MGIIIKNGIIYSSTDDCLKTSGGTMNGEIKYNYNTSDTLSTTAIKITRNGYNNVMIGSRTPTDVTGNLNVNVACGNPGSGQQKTFNINGYESGEFSIRFGDADFGFIEQKTFDLAKNSTYSGSLISKPLVVLIFPVVGDSGSAAATTENNPVYTATQMSTTGFKFKNLTDFTKFRYVALGVPSDYSK